MSRKPAFLVLFFCFSKILVGQANNLPSISITANTGPATYWNKKITNVGFAHDYQYGQMNSLGFNAKFPIHVVSLTFGLNYQYLFFNYKGVGPFSQELQQIQTIYRYKGIQHAIEAPISLIYPFNDKYSLGLAFTPRYILSSKDYYLKEGVGILNVSDEETINRNSSDWNKFQLLGRLVFSRNFNLKSENQFSVHISTNISLNNPGGTDVFATPLSTPELKSRFISGQIGLSYSLN
jgi:hypothetical protein